MHMNGDARCSSCGIRLTMKHSTVFNCPRCNETLIGRCDQCRDQSVQYECMQCGFIGP